ncbi:MAG: class I SAM-dependent methyltransferase [Candidatus Lindowbacteria bacterium]|nr:class I SAM-dependent methyltransferase [Candidatus Lindowbacteria bacterium]
MADLIRNKYRLTGFLYDILDYPWERQYRLWRGDILKEASGNVIEAGVGTGRNLEYYSPDARVTGFDLSETMLMFATKRAARSRCQVKLIQADAARMGVSAPDYFDWYVPTFMYCVMPNDKQPAALAEMARILKPGGRFRLIEMVYSKDPELVKKQKRFAPFVEKVYGARFDRNTLQFINQTDGLTVTSTKFLKADTSLLINGIKE